MRINVWLLSHVWFLQPHGLLPAKFLCPRDFSGKNTRVGCHFLLQGIFLPWDQICISCVSCFAGKFFALWAIRETHSTIPGILNTYDTVEFVYIYLGLDGFASDSVVKNPPVKQEIRVQSLR